METLKMIVRWYYLHLFPERFTNKIIRDTGYYHRDPLFSGKNFRLHSWPDENYECRFRSVAVPLADDSRYTISQAIALLLGNYCARPERQDAVLFGLFLKKNPTVFRGNAYVFVHKPLSMDNWDFVTVFRRTTSNAWTVFVYENKIGNVWPIFSRNDLFIGLYDN